MINPPNTTEQPRIFAHQRLFRSGNKLYDLGTSNKSFLKVAFQLKELGIENWYFMLEVKDPSVIHIDPHSVDPKTNLCNLTKDQVERVTIEVARNYWYYAREVVRIVDPGGKPVPYKANRGNIASTWCALNGIDNWLCLPRQQGKTVGELTLTGWSYAYGTRNSDAIFLNKTKDDSNKNLARMKEILNNNPSYLKNNTIVDEMGVRSKARDNTTMAQHPITGNTITTKGKGTSKESALSIARGLTTSIQYFDEAEFTPFIDIIVRNSVSSYSTASERAEANGTFYSRIFTSTPGDLDTKPGMAAEELLSQTQPFTEKMYDMTREEARAYAQSPGHNGIVYIEYSWKQLGLTRDWLRKQADRIGDPVTVRRELLLQRIHGSSDSPYQQEDLMYIAEAGKEPLDGEELILLGLFQMQVYAKLDKTTPYIISVDCATGTLGDNDAITVINPYSYPVPEPVAEFECGYISEVQLSSLLIELITKYLPKGVLCIEKNHVGSAVINILMNSTVARNVYFDKDKDLAGMELRGTEDITSILKRKAMEKRFYGVSTNTVSRADMFRILDRHVYEYKENFITKNIIRDLQRLVRRPSGKVEAGSGHDDSLMSYLIGLYVWYHGDNLPAFHIDKGSQEIHNQNEGMAIPDISTLSEIFNQKEIELLKEQMEDPDKEFNKSLRQAIHANAEESKALTKIGLKKQGTTLEELESKNIELMRTIQEGYTYEDYQDEGTLDWISSLNKF